MSGLPDRFWAKVDKDGPGGCWLWTGSKNDGGYGLFSWEGRVRRAHRVSFAAHVRLVGPRELVDHMCLVRACVNPQHLQVATKSENGQNRAGLDPRNRSGHRGVSWCKRDRRWQVRVRVDNRTHFGGNFVDLDEAATAAVALRNQLMTNNLLDRREAA